MIEINLLPWRVLKKEKQRQQLEICCWVISIGIMLGLSFLHFYIEYGISKVTKSVAAYENKLYIVETPFQEIKKLQLQLQQQVCNVQFTKNILTNQASLTDFFSNLINLTPKNISLSVMTHQQNEINLLGQATNTFLITQFLQALPGAKLVTISKDMSLYNFRVRFVLNENKL